MRNQRCTRVLLLERALCESSCSEREKGTESAGGEDGERVTNAPPFRFKEGLEESGVLVRG